MIIQESARERTRTDVIMHWYHDVFPPAATYIRKKGGTLEEAKEIFQEAIVTYYEKLVLTGFEPKDDDHAYLMGIVKNKWLRHQKRTSMYTTVMQPEAIEDNCQQPLTGKLLDHLKQAGEKCMELLQSFYYQNLSMQQLAVQFGYASERSATVQKYKCLEKVRDEIKRKSMHYEDFLD